MWHGISEDSISWTSYRGGFPVTLKPGLRRLCVPTNTPLTMSRRSQPKDRTKLSFYSTNFGYKEAIGYLHACKKVYTQDSHHTEYTDKFLAEGYNHNNFARSVGIKLGLWESNGHGGYVATQELYSLLARQDNKAYVMSFLRATLNDYGQSLRNTKARKAEQRAKKEESRESARESFTDYVKERIKEEAIGSSTVLITPVPVSVTVSKDRVTIEQGPAGDPANLCISMPEKFKHLEKDQVVLEGDIKVGIIFGPLVHLIFE